MKRSRFTGVKIIEILRLHAAGAKAADLCREHGISGQNLTELARRSGKVLEAIRTMVRAHHPRGEDAGRCQ